MPRRGSFNVSARNFFLTYSRCSISKEEALDQLKNIQCATNKKFIRVCREFHEDGCPHLHVLIQFEGKFQCTNQRHFDITNPHNSEPAHPNIQSARSSAHVKQYIAKGGDFVDWGTFQQDKRCNIQRSGLDQAYQDAYDSGSVQTALDIIRTNDPRTFILQHHNIRPNLEKIFTPPQEVYAPEFAHSSFTITPTMASWMDSVFQINTAARPGENKLSLRCHRPISIIIEGPSRTGKTVWARSIGRHNYIAGHLDFNSRVFSNDALYNVIDDVPPNYLKLKHWKELIGAQRNWQSNCKYQKPVQIKGGIPAIVLCNPGEGSSYKIFLDNPDNSALKLWTLKNAIFEEIYQPLYQATAPSSEEEETTTTTDRSPM